MRLNLNQWAAHLAQPLKPVYVVGGEEPLLVQEALDALRAAARRQGYSERESLDADRYFEWSRLLEAGASLSLFASRRIIELNLPSGAPGTEGSKTLQQYAERPPPDVLFILTCGEIEWRSRQGAWYSALESAGGALYIEPVKTADFVPWLTARSKQEGVKLEPEAIQELAERTEGNLLAAAQDLAKLKLLFPGETVGVEQLRDAVADSARFEAFDLNDRWLAGDAEGVVRSLARLREEGAALPEILGAFVFSMRQLAKAAAIFAQTRSADVASDRAGVRKPSRPLFAQALARLRPAETLAFLSRCARVDFMSKSGQEAAAWEELLTLALAAAGARKLTA